MTQLSRLFLHRRVGALLRPWQGARPGMTVGVVQDGALVLHESAGLASLELAVPIGAETCFRVASVSKQFTCAAVLLLAAEGLLDIAAPLRTVLPDMPDPAGGLTLDQLMHNSGGVRDMLEIMRQGGADLGLAVQPEALLAGVARQRHLNFAPGTRFLYSNSGFMLLGRAIEAVTGQALADVLHTRLFGPLGMTRTRHAPDPRTPEPGLCTGYLPRRGAWVRAAHAFPLGGEGGLVSCIEDLALWDRAFGGTGPAPTAALQQQDRFPNGTPNQYLRGLRGDMHRGTPTISHGGLWPGYRTEFLRAPQHGVTVIAMTNDGGSDPAALAHQVLDVLLDGRPGIHPIPALPARDTLAPLTGRWVNEAGTRSMEFAVGADGVPTATLGGTPVRLSLAEDGRLSITHGTILLALRAAGPDTLEVEQDAGFSALWHRAPPSPALPDGLAGRYVSEEMAATWDFDAEGVTIDGPLVRGVRHRTEPVAPNLLRVCIPGLLNPAWWDVQVLRDASGAPHGLLVHTNRLWGVEYRRCDRAGQ